jgi:thiol-disulfide isomerase/thioredoxin
MRLAAAVTVAGAVIAAAPAGTGAAPQGFAVHPEPQALPEVTFDDGDGAARSLADFAGKVVLLNVWATWCGPCRDELPTLDRLQAELGGPGFVVVALSIDRDGPEVVRAFFDEAGIAHLDLYIDPTGNAAYGLGAVGLPTTVLIGRDGREIGRLIGPAEWDAPAMTAFIRDTVAGVEGSEQ